MKQTSIFLIAIAFYMLVCIPAAAAHKPKMVVQLYGESYSTPVAGMGEYAAYLILPDGSHATAICMLGPGTAPCMIEPFVAEKRVKVSCDLMKGSTKSVVCYQSELYEAERKNNDITLRTGSGRVKYHVLGSW
jgi:hypothetical protein